jgi:hypothetical protein
MFKTQYVFSFVQHNARENKTQQKLLVHCAAEEPDEF